MIADLPLSVDFLYTNIGRGHPHYLDGIVEALPSELVGKLTDVFSVPSLSTRLAWRAVRAAYVAGAKGGLLSRTYSRFRSHADYNRLGVTRHLLGSGLGRTISHRRPVVVAHPLLVALLRGRGNLVYQHGEAVAPHESLVNGRHRIIVPLTRTADTFAASGFSTDQIYVSGLCVEASLVALAERAMDERRKRLAGSAPLCGAFFSSGAEPNEHVATIVTAATSVHCRRGRAIVFVQQSGKVESEIRSCYKNLGFELTTVDAQVDYPKHAGQTLLCPYTCRKDLNTITASMFSEFDFFVAPSHERTNWALGLGLPMYVVDPPLGSFAPLNRELLLDEGVAMIIDNRGDAQRLADTTERHRQSGELRAMSEAGWQRHDIHGYANIAGMLESEYCARTPN